MQHSELMAICRRSAVKAAAFPAVMTSKNIRDYFSPLRFGDFGKSATPESTFDPFHLGHFGESVTFLGAEVYRHVGSAALVTDCQCEYAGHVPRRPRTILCPTERHWFPIRSTSISTDFSGMPRDLPAPGPSAPARNVCRRNLPRLPELPRNRCENKAPSTPDLAVPDL